ncbi:MAG: phage tail tape measure protein [Proteobacteria bacterium]|nr:phage tail tape measure protein [Pseudomonadota bacterium]
MAALRSSVQEANKFQSAIAEVSTLLDDTSSLESMTRATRELAIQYGSAPTEQANALYNIISAGAKEGAEATGLLEQANKLAAAGLTDVNTAANGLTSVLNAYNLSADQAGVISDQFFAIVREGKTTVGELSGAVGRVIPLAAQAGVQFNEVGAALATLTAQGVSTDEAVTQVRGVLQAVLKPTAEATKAAEELGLQFDAQALKAKGLRGFLEDVERATQGNVSATTKLFGNVEGLSAVLGLGGESAEAFAEKGDRITNSFGETNKALEKTQNQADFTSRQFKAAFNDLQITVGNLVNKGLVPLQQVATSLIQTFTDLPEPLQATIAGATGLTAAVVALTAAKRTLLPVFGAVATQSAATTSALTAQSVATRTVAGATNFFYGILRRAPYIALIAEVSRFVGVYSEYRAAADQAAKAQERVNKQLREGIAAARENAAAAAEGASGAKAAIDAIAGGIDNLTASQRAFYQSNLQEAEKYLKAQIAIGVREQELHGQTSIALGEVGEQLRAVRAAQEQLGAEIQRQADGPYDALQKRVDELRENFNGLGDDIGDVAAGTLQELADRARANLDEARQAVVDVRAEFPNLQNVSDEALARIDQGFADAIGRVEELNGIINSVSQEALRRLGVDASKALTGVRTEVRELIGAFDTLAADSTTDARLIEAAYSRVLEKLDSPAELDAFEASLRKAARAGFDVGDALEAVRVKARGVGEEAQAQGEEVARVTQEYGRLGDAAEDAGRRAEAGHRRAAGAARDQARATRAAAEAAGSAGGSTLGGATTIASREGPDAGQQSVSPIDQELIGGKIDVLTDRQRRLLDSEQQSRLLALFDQRFDDLIAQARSDSTFQGTAGARKFADRQNAIFDEVRRRADALLSGQRGAAQSLSRDLGIGTASPEATGARRSVDVNLNIGGERITVQAPDSEADRLLEILERAQGISAQGA